MGLKEGMSLEDGESLAGGANIWITLRPDGSAKISQPPRDAAEAVWSVEEGGVEIFFPERRMGRGADGGWKSEPTGGRIQYLIRGHLIQDDLLEFSSTRDEPSYEFYRTLLRRIR